MSAVTKKEREAWAAAFKVGRAAGRKEMLEEIQRALGIDELVAKEIERHEQQMHGLEL